jgi:hypothetical protein
MKHALLSLSIGVSILTATPPAALAQISAASEPAVMADFARRVQRYVDLRESAARTVAPLRTLADPAEIRARSDALAAAIRQARADARQGDVVTAAAAELMRRIVADTCDRRFVELLAFVNDELDAPLPRAAVNARFPRGAPLSTMMPDLLAALPALPGILEYRFVGRDLVLWDVDANVIVDYVPDAIPTT